VQFTQFLRINNWIPARQPRLFTETGLQLLSKEESGRNKVKLLFRVTGPDHTNIFLSPYPKTKITAWSFDENGVLAGPVWKDKRPTHFIFYSHGLRPLPWDFWLEMSVPKTHNIGSDPLMDAIVVGHFLHGNEMKSPDFKKFLAQYPKWSHPIGWTASLREYAF